MSDTPRMESVAGHARGIVDAGILAEGMKLERELNAANERIKRLEEAGNELRDLCVSRWMGDVLDQAELVCATDNWNKATAKKAKP